MHGAGKATETKKSRREKIIPSEEMVMIESIPAEEDTRPDVNLTPMLDVVFILLIFFVVTATFVRESGLEITLPAGVVVPDDIETIMVTVESGGNFHVNGRALAKGNLAPYIRRLRSEFTDAGITVFVAPDAFVEDTVAAVDAGRRAGFGRVPISPLPD